MKVKGIGKKFTGGLSAFLLGVFLGLAPFAAATAQEDESVAKEQDKEVEEHMQGAILRAASFARRNVEQPADVEETACLDGLHGIDTSIFSADVLDTWGMLYKALIDTLRNFACSFVVMFYNAKLGEGLGQANAFVDEFITGPMNKMAADMGLPPDFMDQFDLEFKANPDGEYGAESKIKEYSFIEEHGVGMLEDLLNDWASDLWDDYDPSLFNKRQAESKKARKKTIEAAKEAGEAPFGGVPIFPTSREDWKKVGDMSWSDIPKGVVAVSSSLMVDLADLGVEIGGGLSDHALKNPLEFSKNCLAAVGTTRKVPGCFEEEKK